ncbi:MAG: hypothetical protein QXE50_08195 [Nitrososphaerota archaeon]
MAARRKRGRSVWRGEGRLPIGAYSGGAVRIVAMDSGYGKRRGVMSAALWPGRYDRPR